MSLKHYNDDRCAHCMLSKRCFSETHDSARYKTKVSRHNTLDKDQNYYRRGNDCGQIAVVQSGAFKLVLDVPNQAGQIVELVLPGDYIGLDALYSDTHEHTAIALDRSRVCVVPTQHLFEADSATLLKRSMAHNAWHRLLPRFSAPARVAQMLLRLSQSQTERGLKGCHVTLPLTRTDLANYLMLALETVSRTLTGFSSKGLIEIRGKQVTLLEPTRLETIACDQPVELPATSQA